MKQEDRVDRAEEVSKYDEMGDERQNGRDGEKNKMG